MIELLIGIIIIIIGLVILFLKYRVVIGATKCMGRLEYFEENENYLVFFAYKDEPLLKRALNLISPIHNDGEFTVYYNPNRPRYVIKRSLDLDAMGLVLIGIGYLIAAGYFT